MSRGDGFTLTETLIALAVVSLLITAAMPAYTQSRTRVERNEGRIALLRLATQQVTHYVQRGRYATDMTELGFLEPIALTEHERFRLEVTEASGSGFTLRATRVNPASDDQCQWFSLDQSQRRASGPADNQTCWFR